SKTRVCRRLEIAEGRCGSSESLGARRRGKTGAARARNTSRGARASARAARVAHQEPEIEGAGVHDQSLQDVGMAAQVHPAQAAGVIDMGKRPLDIFPTG